MVELGLIGRTLGHSFSRSYFTGKFLREGIDGRYDLFPIPDIDSLPALLDAHPALRGLNVTIPYKESVIPLLDSVSNEAAEIGAVNVIRIDVGIDGRRRLEGHNTDWIGFHDSAEPLCKGVRRALVLGTGGACKAVRYALRSLGIPSLAVSRDPVDKPYTIGYGDITRDIMAECRLLVNTTPLGMFPDMESYPDIPYRFISPQHICIDLVYNPAVTRFMALCAENGATVKNGLEMLHLQAEHAWTILS